MAIDWKIVRAEHVARACDLVAQGSHRKPTRGLFVVHKDTLLPAKEVARVAYLEASGKGPDTELRFASGEATLNLLRRLGFHVERVGTSNKATSDIAKD